ncbi:MAG: protein translocase subunit SecF [Candidatus Aminicenantes bacterium]|nr:protein translocase subunit SecF [Candidatus Aminicenantes bacterium]
MQIFKNPNYKFMKYKLIALAISGIIITIGLINIFAGKGLTGGIDFTGGALIQIRFDQARETGELRQLLLNNNFDPKIQRVGEDQKEFIIRVMLPEDQEITDDQELEAHLVIGNKIVDILTGSEEKANLEKGLIDLNNIDIDELTALLSNTFPDNPGEIAQKIINFRESNESKGIIENNDQLRNAGIDEDVISLLKEKTFLGSLAVKRRETVGPQVGEDLRNKATQATIWALIGMLLYIGIRFKFAYGVSAIITLAHDVLITLGIFSLTNREINLPVIAAILTIVGYSLNDTIVIFDRVRDNIKLLRKEKFENVLDASINQTLSRTIITSGTTFFTVLALFLFGGKVINDFAFTMMIGVIIGTYSSIYQSCSLLYFWKKIFNPKKGMGK